MLPEQNARVRLNDILFFVEEIFSFVAGMTQTEFYKDRRTANAVVLDFIHIGEAVVNIPAEIQAEYPEIPWRLMKNMRNFLAHVYSGIDPGKVWTTIHEDLPPLVPLLRIVLDSLETRT